jgi:AraC-like DNA-binding protein
VMGERNLRAQLLRTLRPVREVAYEVGFDDEFYFSRLFKRCTGCSPQFYREYETEIRAGRQSGIGASKHAALNRWENQSIYGRRASACRSSGLGNARDS